MIPLDSNDLGTLTKTNVFIKQCPQPYKIKEEEGLVDLLCELASENIL